MDSHLYSLLSYEPGWRYLYATKKTTSEARKLNDKILNRYLDALDKQSFIDDPKLDCAISMKPRSRGQLEALALGGADREQISKVTCTDLEVVDLILRIYFDIDIIKGEPLLRMNIANQEHDKYIRSFKVFAAKYGWKKLLQTYYRKDEFVSEGDGSLTPTSIIEDLLYELSRKITEVGTYTTGSAQSKELVQWMKLTLDTCREVLREDTDEDKSKDSDITKIMENIGRNEKLSFSRESLKFLGNAPPNPKKDISDEDK